MRKKILRYCLFLLLIPVFIGINAAADDQLEAKGTIWLKDGRIYKDVNFRVMYKTSVVQFIYKASKKNINFSEIFRIVDEQGNDITRTIPKKPLPPKNKEGWRPKTDPNAKKPPLKYWNIGLCLSGNLFFPLGDYYYGFEPGPGFDAELLLPVNHKFGFRAVVSYSGTRAHEDLAVFAGEDYGSGILFYDYKLTSMIYMACLQWYPNPGPLEPGSVLFSLHVGIGAITHRMEATQVSVAWDGTLSNPTQLKLKETKFAWRPMGMQVTYMVGSNLGFHAGMAMTVVRVENSRAIQSEVKLGVTLFSKYQE